MTSTTVADADRMLPLVRRIVLNARARRRLIQRKSEQASRAVDPDERRRHKAAADRLKSELQGYVAELSELGCELLDAATGVVGRKALHGGRTVTVVWRPGHAAFQEWFGDGESWTDRRPLSVTPEEASAGSRFDV